MKSELERTEAVYCPRPTGILVSRICCQLGRASNIREWHNKSFDSFDWTPIAVHCQIHPALFWRSTKNVKKIIETHWLATDYHTYIPLASFYLAIVSTSSPCRLTLLIPVVIVGRQKGAYWEQKFISSWYNSKQSICRKFYSSVSLNDCQFK